MRLLGRDFYLCLNLCGGELWFLGDAGGFQCVRKDAYGGRNWCRGFTHRRRHDDAVSEDASCSTECGAVAGICNFLDHESSIELGFLDPFDSEYQLANVTAGATDFVTVTFAMGINSFRIKRQCFAFDGKILKEPPQCTENTNVPCRNADHLLAPQMFGNTSACHLIMAMVEADEPDHSLSGRLDIT